MLGPAKALLATIISLDSGTSVNTLASLLVTGACAVIHHTRPVELGRDGVAPGTTAAVVVGATVVVVAEPVPALLARLVGLLEPGTTTTSIVG